MSGSPESRPFEDIRVLILEDSPADAELIEHELRGAGFIFRSKLVGTKKAYLHGIKTFHPDIILSDYDLPSFSGAEALQIRKKICPETPFILVTGAIGEERAIEILTGGATEYVLKRNLSRLLPAVRRALHENYEHRKRKEAEAERDNLLKELERRVLERTVALEREIAERKRTEEALKKSEEGYRLIVQYAPAGIYEIDYTVPRFKHVNDTMCRLSGYTREEFMKLSPFDLLDSDSKALFRERLQKISAGQAVDQNVSFRGFKKNGQDIWVVLNIRPELNAEGRAIGALVVAHDITERRRAEEELRTKDAALEEAKTGIAVADPEGRLTYANKALLSMWGYECAGEVLGRYAVEFWVSPEEAEAALKGARAGAWSGELQALRKDGSTFISEVQAASVLDQNGSSVGLIGTFMDITGRKRADQEREKLISELEATNRELESFAYSVSHDLRAPLRAIDGFSSVLMKALGAKLNQEERHGLEVILDNTKKMNHLIDDLLVLSRLGRTEIAFRKINMGKLAEAVWRQQLEANPGRIVSFKRSDLPGSFGDESLLWQVFSNLLSNALKYTRTRKKAVIRIGGERISSESVYFVGDNGAGFDMAYYEKLFGVFQRLHPESEYEGTGVGLAIVQRIIHRHGGRVWAKGKPGKGATFYFTLPNRAG